MQLYKNIPIAYIAGPFTSNAKNAWEMEQNIRRAEILAAELWKLKFSVICPHTNTRFFHGLTDYDVFIRGDLRQVEVSDVVITTDFWQDSDGAVGEVVYAKSLSIPVFHFMEREAIMKFREEFAICQTP